jgi:hypothetical protein
MPVTVGSSAREVGRRKLNFGNPAERQGIRVFGSEAERGDDGYARRRGKS